MLTDNALNMFFLNIFLFFFSRYNCIHIKNKQIKKDLNILELIYVTIFFFIRRENNKLQWFFCRTNKFVKGRTEDKANNSKVY